jgi:transcriptional regulator with XRE-family HTH domain
MSEELDAINRIITTIQDEYGLSLKEIAEQAGISDVMLRKIRAGERAGTRLLRKLETLAVEYGVNDTIPADTVINEQRQQENELAKHLQQLTISPLLIKRAGEYLGFPEAFISRAYSNHEFADTLVSMAIDKAEKQESARQEMITRRSRQERLPAPAHSQYAVISQSNIAGLLPAPKKAVRYPLLTYTASRCMTCPKTPPVGVSAEALSEWLYDHPCPHFMRGTCHINQESDTSSHGL